ncbi:4'-phosphopantetheinyl transferase superfamily protein [Flavobacterium sp. Arc2]|uniref:4'-phosphopantetheinyl transferase family protein n=1 Tax=Flavobacterium sp. Arc2 TaxID=3046685 RepID=UPI00352D5C70
MQKSNVFISFSNIMEAPLSPNKNHSLSSNDLIIYSIYLPHFIELKSDLVKFLNSKEVERAERFHKEIDRNRFIIYRSILKFVLSAHTQLDVKSTHFDYTVNKKPYLATHPWLHFNISHSEDYAVIAISRKKVGIDIEYMSKDFDFANVVPDVFEDKEISIIQNAINKKSAFYTLWTRKEAFVKGLGKGIDEDFKYIPCLDGNHIIDSNLLKNTENWQLYSFDLAEHYLGTVAYNSLSTISENLVVYTIPNTMKDLLEMTRIRNNIAD